MTGLARLGRLERQCMPQNIRRRVRSQLRHAGDCSVLHSRALTSSVAKRSKPPYPRPKPVASTYIRRKTPPSQAQFYPQTFLFPFITLHYSVSAIRYKISNSAFTLIHPFLTLLLSSSHLICTPNHFDCRARLAFALRSAHASRWCSSAW